MAKQKEAEKRKVRKEKLQEIIARKSQDREEKFRRIKNAEEEERKKLEEEEERKKLKEK